MAFIKKRIQQCRKPTGLPGKIMGIKMNKRHSELWHWGLEHIAIDPNAHILDVGCGGGKAIYKLAQIATGGRVYGADYSHEMVYLARKVNKKFVENGQVEIIHASVSALPFANDTFDLVTAFETYYFWPNLIGDLKEIKRVLKPDGTLLLTNEAYKHEKFEERNLKLIKSCEMMLHTPEEYFAFLTETGYTAVNIHTLPEKNWITAVAKKNDILE